MNTVTKWLTEGRKTTKYRVITSRNIVGTWLL